MKKNILKISILLFALFGLGFLILKTNAASQNVPVSLTINAGTLTCSNSGVTLSNLNTSYNQQTQTGVFPSNSWTCTDNRGTAWGGSQAMTVVLSTPLSANGGNTIPAANVRMSETFSTSQGNLTGTTTLTSLTAINSSQDIYRKTTANTIGTFVATPTIVITVPANQAPGTYTGTITVTDPS